MKNILRPALVLFFVLTLVTGVAYPLLVTGVAQSLFPAQANGSIILRDGSAMDIAVQAAAEGVESLRRAGLRKVKLGLTSLEEVLAVTNE